MPKSFKIAIPLALGVVLLDQATKLWIVEHLTLTANNFMEQGEMESMPSVFDGRERSPF